MHRLLLTLLIPEEVTVVARLAEEAAVDGMWALAGKQQAPRWLWHTLDHRRGPVLAYVLGLYKDAVVLKLKALLEPCGIVRSYPVLIDL